MKTAIALLCLGTLTGAETITLDPIDIYEPALSAGSYIISKEEAAETGSVTLQERLKRDVAFSVVPDVKGEGAISFRGLDFKATEYVEDGIPLYRSVNGFVDTKFTMRDAELHLNDGSGPSSFGVSPMGGEVNIRSRRPAKMLESKLNTVISTNDEYYHGYVGSRVDKFYIQADADYYHRSDYELSDDYTATPLQGKGKRINSDKRQRSISLKSGIFLSDEIHLAAKAGMTRSEYGMPPNVYADQGTPVVWDAYTRMDRKDLNSFYLYADYDRDEMLLGFRGYYDDYKDVWKIYNDPDYQSAWPAMTYDDNRLGVVLNGALENGEHKSTVIAQAERNEHNAREEGAASDPKFVLDTFKGSYLHFWKFSETWCFDGALSYTLLQDKKRENVGALSQAEDKEAWDALAKATYTDDGSTLYASVAKKSRMPAMNEMFTFFPWEASNPGLNPERSMQYAVGYQQEVDETSLLDLSLYYYDIRDLIIYRNSGYINRDEAENYGAELRMESERYRRHYLRFSYAYAHTRDSEGEALELIPEHRIKLEDTLTFTGRWKGYLGYQYVGSRYSNNTATYTDEQKKLSAYHLVDLQVSYEGIKQTVLRAGLKNLLDEAYVWQYGYPSEGRSFYVALEWKL